MNTHLSAPASNRFRIPNFRHLWLRSVQTIGLALLAGILLWEALPVSPALGADAASSPAAFATSIIGKDVQLNGTPMLAGATLFPGDIIRLGNGSTAALRFGNNLVLAAPLTEFVVQSESVSLHNGRIQVRAGGEEKFGISGPFFYVDVAASGGIPGSTEIRLGGTRAQVSAVAGTADLKGAGISESYRLHAGETAMLDASGGDAVPGQGAASPVAGEVSRLVPQVQIDRASQHIVASVSDRVYWNDDLRSGPTGRAHVTLNDGSALNLGSDSSLRVLQHDAQAQQTSLDLLMGRLRGKISKLTRPDAKFEIHTPMGVAGLVGTDFSLQVTDDYVELMVFEGAVRFTGLNGQTATVTAGNKLRISKSGVVSGPSSASAEETQIAKVSTDITGPAGAAPTVAATRSIVPLVITLSGTAAAVGIGVWQGTRGTVSNSIP
jgi:hypothetical protein